MKCGHCGMEVKDDAQFCSNCGHSIEETSVEISEPHKTEKGAYAVSLLALLIVLALTAYASFEIIYRDLYPEKPVSSSDESTNMFNYDRTYTDSALMGKWQCTDRAAADYGEKNFGVEIKIILNLSDDGKFTLNYDMTDTGIPAKSFSTSGKYSTEDGVITFIPTETAEIAEYLKRHGQRPSFRYTAEEGKFTVTYENEKVILFTKVKE